MSIEIAAEPVPEGHGFNSLGLADDELVYLFARIPTSSMRMDGIGDFLPSWQHSVCGNMKMVWEVRAII